MFSNLEELKRFEDSCTSSIPLNKITFKPKKKFGNNGNAHCWLNAPLYVLLAYWDFFKQFHNSEILERDPIECNLFYYEKRYEKEYEDIYNYLDELSRTGIWKTDNYIEMRRRLSILSNKEFPDSKGKIMINNKFDLPRDGSFGNAQEIFPILAKTVFKECPSSSIITESPIQIGIKYPLTPDKLEYIEASSHNPYEYELFAILKPTDTNEYISEDQLILMGPGLRATMGVTHWTAYVRQGIDKDLSLNKWLFFDMLRGGVVDGELDFNDLQKRFNYTSGNQVYSCLFIYLNKNHIA